MFFLIVKYFFNFISYDEEVEELDLSEEIYREVILVGSSLFVKFVIKERFLFWVIIEMLFFIDWKEIYVGKIIVCFMEVYCDLERIFFGLGNF